MESKKNPKADISRNASLYFAIGLALMVFLSYMTINWKVYDKSAIDIGLVNMDELDDEEIPLLEQVVPPPPPFPLLDQSQLIQSPSLQLLLHLLLSL